MTIFHCTKPRPPKSDCHSPTHNSVQHFSYSEIESATNGFSADSFLGKGSHGTVHKAVLAGGELAAVKRITNLDPQSEIEILSRLRDSNFVNLIGFCVDSDDRKLLVVEYMANGSLSDLLHSCPEPPNWVRRIRFVAQIAKALAALHGSDPPVIHRDIKSTNVLIDEKWNARLSDFGLALRGNVDDVRLKCNPAAGTLGYIDPDYLGPEDLSTKSDVFSFGILVLEILSGRKAFDLNFSPPSLVDWAAPLIKARSFGAIFDSRIKSPTHVRTIQSLASLAASCVSPESEHRPDMADVVNELESNRKKVNKSYLLSYLQHGRRHSKPCKFSEPEGNKMESVVKGVIRRNNKVSNVDEGGAGEEGSSVSAASNDETKSGYHLKKKRVMRMRSLVMRFTKARRPCSHRSGGIR